MSRSRREPRGSVRMIGGAWRGRRLTIPAGTGVRPTPDRVRETLFNWLREDVAGACCLDLYAGTGGLGFEALSRGAAEAWLVERDAALARALREHVATLGAAAHVIRGGAEAFLQAPQGAPYDIVFVDPPFEQPVEPVLDALLPLLCDRGSVYVERSVEAGLPAVAGARWRKRGRAAAVEFGLLERD